MYGRIDRRAFAHARWVFVVGGVLMLVVGVVDSTGSHGVAWPLFLFAAVWALVATAGFRIHAAWGPDPYGAPPTWGEIMRGGADPERLQQPRPGPLHLPGTPAQRHLVHSRWGWAVFAAVMLVFGVIGLVAGDPGAVPALVVAAFAGGETVLAFRVTAMWRASGSEVSWSQILHRR